MTLVIYVIEIDLGLYFLYIKATLLKLGSFLLLLNLCFALKQVR